MKAALHIKAKDMLKGAGLYCTEARMAIVKVLLKTHSPLTQDQIAAKCDQRHDKVTIYRTLTSLLETGLVHRALTGDKARQFERLGFDRPTNEPIDGRTKETTNDRSHPEKPQLRNSPISNKDGNTRAASRIYGGIRHRNTNQVNQCKTQANCNRSKALRRTFVGGTENDEQEHHGHNNLSDQSRQQGIPTRRMCTVAV